MATNANPVDASRKDEPGVKEVVTNIPGVGDVTAYFLVETVDDVDQKTKEDVQTLKLSIPQEAEEEVEQEDGTKKTEKFFKTVHLELDLGAASRTKLFKALEPFTKNAREVQAPVIARTATPSKSAHDLNAIREWAKSAGHEVADKGRIAAKVIEAYYKTTGKPNPDAS